MHRKSPIKDIRPIAYRARTLLMASSALIASISLSLSRSLLSRRFACTPAWIAFRQSRGARVRGRLPARMHSAAVRNPRRASGAHTRPANLFLIAQKVSVDGKWSTAKHFLLRCSLMNWSYCFQNSLNAVTEDTKTIRVTVLRWIWKWWSQKLQRGQVWKNMSCKSIRK